jgi:hypothetical protein
MAVIVVTGRVQRFLVDRRGDDAADIARLRGANGTLDIVETGVAGPSIELAERRDIAVERHMLDGNRVRTGGEIERGSNHSGGALQHVAIAEDPDARPFVGRHVGQGLADNLGTDPGRVAHGDSDDGFVHRAARCC